MTNIAIEIGPVEKVDLHSKHGDFPVRELLVYGRVSTYQWTMFSCLQGIEDWHGPSQSGLRWFSRAFNWFKGKPMPQTYHLGMIYTTHKNNTLW